MIPNALTIAGIDPSGGAGIYADLKTFSALGVYGTGVVAALTAQNTVGVTGVHPVPVDFITLQLETLLDDVRIDTVKIGMLGTAEIAAAVARVLRARGVRPIVVDPVMVAKSGHHLLDPAAVATLRRDVLPLADVLTPNLPEAAVLLDRAAPRTLAEMRAAARALCALGPRLVVLKGGHLDGTDSIDIVDDGTTQTELPAPRIATQNTHGTGCTLSAAIAALLPRHAQPLDAIRAAKKYLTQALRDSGQLEVGHGHGPVHHFHAFWR